MNVDRQRLEQSIEELGRIGQTPRGGLTRLALNDEKLSTRHPVTLAIFTNEEGARFQPAMIASGVMAGKIALEDAYNARDKDGIRLVDELERIGYLGPEPCVPRPFRAYLELHI